jgi:hypothetical protein
MKKWKGRLREPRSPQDHIQSNEEKIMKNHIVIILLVSLILFGCSQTGAAQPVGTEMPSQATLSPTEAILLPTSEDQVGGEATPTQSPTEVPPSPTPVPSLIGGELGSYLPSPEDFQDPYSETVFQITNQSLVESWGPDYETILNQTGRQEGLGALYDLEATGANAPGRILVVIERFASLGGSQAFFEYDFPGDFRKGIYLGDPIQLGAADGAILASLKDPNGDDPNALLVTITFRYKNLNAIVEGQGTVDNVSFEYLQPIALSILSKLENAPLND